LRLCVNSKDGLTVSFLREWRGNKRDNRIKTTVTAIKNENNSPVAGKYLKVKTGLFRKFQGRILLVEARGQHGGWIIINIHWSSGSHKRSTNWANHVNYNFGRPLQVVGPEPWPPGPSKSDPGNLKKIIIKA